MIKSYRFDYNENRDVSKSNTFSNNPKYRLINGRYHVINKEELSPAKHIEAQKKIEEQAKKEAKKIITDLAKEVVVQHKQETMGRDWENKQLNTQSLEEKQLESNEDKIEMKRQLLFKIQDKAQQMVDEQGDKPTSLSYAIDRHLEEAHDKIHTDILYLSHVIGDQKKNLGIAEVPEVPLHGGLSDEQREEYNVADQLLD